MQNLNVASVYLAGWATPTTRDHKDGTSFDSVPVNGLLGRQVGLAGWNTPRATDGSDGGPNQAGGALSADAALTGSPAQTEKRGALNPAFSLWLQGFPPEWMASAPSAASVRSAAREIRSSRK
jgi:hypothetical protein